MSIAGKADGLNTDLFILLNFEMDNHLAFFGGLQFILDLRGEVGFLPVFLQDFNDALLHRVQVENGSRFQVYGFLEFAGLDGFVALELDPLYDRLFLHDEDDRFPPVPVPPLGPDILKVTQLVNRL